MVYCHASGSTLDELSSDFQRHVDMGYLAIRAQAAIPGLMKTYGIAPTDGQIYEPASGNVPQQDIWETSAYLDFAPQVMAHLRREFGYVVHLLHDVHHRLTPIEAARLGAALEPYRMFWIEDPTPAEDQSAFRLIRQHTTTPIAVGEVFNSIWDCQQLITERLIDYIRTSVSTPAASPTCAESSPWPTCTGSAPARTVQATSRRSLWPPRCTSTSASRTSASRSTWGTATRRRGVLHQLRLP